MSKDLVEKIRKQRELKVVAGKFTFTARRPTDVEAIALGRADSAFSKIAEQFVVGWDGVTEDDLIQSGASNPIPFDAVLWAEWCADRPDLWGTISTAVLDAYRLHAKRLEDGTKN
jgi:hypothetical protein